MACDTCGGTGIVAVNSEEGGDGSRACGCREQPRTVVSYRELAQPLYRFEGGDLRALVAAKLVRVGSPHAQSLSVDAGILRRIWKRAARKGIELRKAG